MEQVTYLLDLNDERSTFIFSEVQPPFVPPLIPQRNSVEAKTKMSGDQRPKLKTRIVYPEQAKSGSSGSKRSDFTPQKSSTVTSSTTTKPKVKFTLPVSGQKQKVDQAGKSGTKKVEHTVQNRTVSQSVKPIGGNQNVKSVSGSSKVDQSVGHETKNVKSTVENRSQVQAGVSGTQNVQPAAGSSGVAGSSAKPAKGLPETINVAGSVMKRTTTKDGQTVYVPITTESNKPTNQERSSVADPTGTVVKNQLFNYPPFSVMKYPSCQSTTLTIDDADLFLDITFSRLSLENLTHLTSGGRMRIVNTYALVKTVGSGKGKEIAPKVRVPLFVSKNLRKLPNGMINCNLCSDLFKEEWNAICHLESHVSTFFCSKTMNNVPCIQTCSSSREFVIHVLKDHFRIELGHGYRLVAIQPKVGTGMIVTDLPMSQNKKLKK